MIAILSSCASFWKTANDCWLSYFPVVSGHGETFLCFSVLVIFDMIKSLGRVIGQVLV